MTIQWKPFGQYFTVALFVFQFYSVYIKLFSSKNVVIRDYDMSSSPRRLIIHRRGCFAFHFFAMSLVSVLLIC